MVGALLAQPGVDAAACDNYAVCLAAQNGHVAIVRHLLQQPGVDAAARNNYPLRGAAMHGQLEVVRLLVVLLGVVEATACGNEAVCVAAAHGHVEVVRYLVSQPGVDPRAVVEDHSTAACYAIAQRAAWRLRGPLVLLRQLQLVRRQRATKM